jgi:peptide/nickel transport system permease protein
MGKFILRRLAQSAFLVLGVAIIVFCILRFIPGDPVLLMAAPGTPKEALEGYRILFGLDKPFGEQLIAYLVRLAQGDFGTSFRYQEPTLPIVLARLPNTVRLTFLGLFIGLLVAIPLGVEGARHRGSLIDRFGLVVSIAGQSLPVFWVGLLLVLVFSIRLQVFPAIGSVGWKSVVLPSLTLGLAVLPPLLRMVRTQMIDALSQDFILTARVFGLSSTRVYYWYALKNASIGLITILGVQIGYLIGGSVVVEMIFNYPGVGMLMMNSLNARDFPMIQTIAVVVSITFVLINLAVDLIYGLLDPRIHVES